MCRINYRSASSYSYLNEWDSVTMEGNKPLAMSMASTSVTGMNLNRVPERPKQWNGCLGTETCTNPAPGPESPAAQMLSEIWNCLAKISPFSPCICSRDLGETDIADHWKNSHKQHFMHSKAAITEQKPLKDAVTEPPALPERGGQCLVQEDTGLLPHQAIRLLFHLQNLSGWWSELQECPPAPRQPGPAAEAQMSCSPTSPLQFLFRAQLGNVTDCSCWCKISSSFPCSLKWKTV